MSRGTFAHSCQLVVKRIHILSLANAIVRWCSKGINGPLFVGSVCFALGAEAEERGFFWGEEGKLIAKILAIANSRSLAKFWLGGIGLISA